MAVKGQPALNNANKLFIMNNLYWMTPDSLRVSDWRYLFGSSGLVAKATGRSSEPGSCYRMTNVCFPTDAVAREVDLCVKQPCCQKLLYFF